MRTSRLSQLILVAFLAALLSGCIVIPVGDDGWHGGHHRGGHHGEFRGGHWGHWGHGWDD